MGLTICLPQERFQRYAEALRECGAKLRFGDLKDCDALLLPGGGDRAVEARKALDRKTASMEKAIDEAAELEEAGLDEKQKTENIKKKQMENFKLKNTRAEI